MNTKREKGKMNPVTVTKNYIKVPYSIMDNFYFYTKTEQRIIAYCLKFQKNGTTLEPKVLAEKFELSLKQIDRGFDGLEEKGILMYNKFKKVYTFKGFESEKEPDMLTPEPEKKQETNGTKVPAKEPKKDIDSIFDTDFLRDESKVPTLKPLDADNAKRSKYIFDFAYMYFNEDTGKEWQTEMLTMGLYSFIETTKKYHQNDAGLLDTISKYYEYQTA